MKVDDAIKRLQEISKALGNIELVIEVEIEYCSALMPVGGFDLIAHPDNDGQIAVKVTD